MGLRGVETHLNFFITSETTSDVTHTELPVLLDFEDMLNRVASDLQMAGVEQIGIVLVVMNPEVVPPFPPGFVFRRARKMLDIKPAVAFTKWKEANRNGRIGLLIDATVSTMSGRPKKAVSGQEISALEAALQRAYRALLN